MVHKDVSRKNSERVESEGFLLSPSSSLPLITLLTFFLVSDFALHSTISGVDLGGGCRGTHPPSPLRWPESFYYNWYSVLKFVYVTSQFRHSEYLEEANLPGVRIVYNFIWPGVADELTTVWVKILAIPGVYLGPSTLPLFRTNICLTFAVHSFVSYWTSTLKSTPCRWFRTRSAILTGVLQALVLHHWRRHKCTCKNVSSNSSLVANNCSYPLGGLLARQGTTW